MLCSPFCDLLHSSLHSGQLLPEPGLHCHVCCVWNSDLSSHSGGWDLHSGLGKPDTSTPPVLESHSRVLAPAVLTVSDVIWVHLHRPAQATCIAPTQLSIAAVECWLQCMYIRVCMMCL